MLAQGWFRPRNARSALQRPLANILHYVRIVYGKNVEIPGLERKIERSSD